MKRAFISITGLLLILGAAGTAQAYGPGGAWGGAGMPSPADWNVEVKLYPGLNMGNSAGDVPDNAPDAAVRVPRTVPTAPSVAPKSKQQ